MEEVCIGGYSLGGYNHVEWETKRAVPVLKNTDTVMVFVEREELRQEFSPEEIERIERGWTWIARNRGY